MAQFNPFFELTPQDGDENIFVNYSRVYVQKCAPSEGGHTPDGDKIVLKIGFLVRLICAVSHCDNLSYHGLTAQCNLFWLHPWMGMSVPFVWLTCAVSHCDNLSYHGLTTQCNLFWLHPRMGMSVLEAVFLEGKEKYHLGFVKRKKISEEFFVCLICARFPL